MLNPDSFPTPRLTAARMARVPAASAALDDMPEAELGRTILSLRWFEQTQQTQPSADSLLQAWIAIEALVMDGTNIAPIGRSPGALYGLEPERAKAKYMIGRIYDLRGRIVHGTSRGHLDHRLPASEWTRRFDDCPSGARCPRHHRDR